MAKSQVRLRGFTAGGDHSFRKDIVNIANYFDTKPREAKKMICKLIEGSISLTEASDISVQGGVTDRDY